MADAKPLDFRVLRNGVTKDEFQVSADPTDTDALEKRLKSWLEGKRWHPVRWKDFEAEVRARGDSKVLAKVRCP